MKMVLRLGKFKWMAGVAAILVLVMSAPGTSEAGRRYSGIDPILIVDGYKFNVRIEWPSEYDCSINGPIQVNIRVPARSTTEFIAESTGDLGGCVQETTTTMDDYRSLLDKSVYISAKVPADDRFLATLKVDVSGEMFRELDGLSNRWIRLPGISMLEVRLADVATGLDDESEDELTYTYDDDERRDQYYAENFVDETVEAPVSSTVGILGRTTGLLFGR